jgi:hypothetical protein
MGVIKASDAVMSILQAEKTARTLAALDRMDNHERNSQANCKAERHGNELKRSLEAGKVGGGGCLALRLLGGEREQATIAKSGRQLEEDARDHDHKCVPLEEPTIKVGNDSDRKSTVIPIIRQHLNCNGKGTYPTAADMSGRLGKATPVKWLVTHPAQEKRTRSSYRHRSAHVESDNRETRTYELLPVTRSLLTHTEEKRVSRDR